MNRLFSWLLVVPMAFMITFWPVFPSFASELSTPSEALEETGLDDIDSGGVDNPALEDLLNEYEWRLMQMDNADGSSVDNASIFQIAENSSDIIQLLYFTDFLLVLLLGALLASIFSRYFKSW